MGEICQVHHVASAECKFLPNILVIDNLRHCVDWIDSWKRIVLSFKDKIIIATSFHFGLY